MYSILHTVYNDCLNSLCLPGKLLQMMVKRKTHTYIHGEENRYDGANIK